MPSNFIKIANWMDTIQEYVNSAKDSLSSAKPYLTGAGIGGAGGATLAGLASASVRDQDETPAQRRRRILRNALAGGTMGAGLGATIPALMDTIGSAAPPPTKGQRAGAALAGEWGDDKPLGGFLGHLLGGAGGYGAARQIQHGSYRDAVRGRADDLLKRLDAARSTIHTGTETTMAAIKGKADEGAKQMLDAWLKQPANANANSNTIADKLKEFQKSMLSDTEARKALASASRSGIKTNLSPLMSELRRDFGKSDFALSNQSNSTDAAARQLFRKLNQDPQALAKQLKQVSRLPFGGTSFTGANIGLTPAGTPRSSGKLTVGLTTAGLMAPWIVPNAAKIGPWVSNFLSSTLSSPSQ